jgi:phage terminase small subunit
MHHSPPLVSDQTRLPNSHEPYGRCRGLTAKQRRFVEEYLIDLNGTQAAIRAGYSSRTARAIGSENLTKPDIQAAIERAMADRGARTGLTAELVLAEVALIAFSDIRDIDFGPDGQLVERSPGASRAVAARAWSHKVRRTGHQTKYSVRLWDKLTALRLLMQHFGLLDPKRLPTLESVLSLFPPDLRAKIVKYISESPPPANGQPHPSPTKPNRLLGKLGAVPFEPARPCMFK